MPHVMQKPSLNDIDWLRGLFAAGRNRDAVLRLATIKFGHRWGAEVATLVDAIEFGMQAQGVDPQDAEQALARALKALERPDGVRSAALAGG